MAQNVPPAADKLVPLAEVKALLEKADAARGELSYEQKLALEHARRFARYSSDDAKAAIADLTSNPKIDYTTAVRILDTAPNHADDVRALFSKSRANLDEAETQKVLEIVKKYATA